MKPLFAVFIALMTLSIGCKTTGPKPSSPDAVEQRTTKSGEPDDEVDSSSAPDGPFEVAEAWTQNHEPTSDTVESVASEWSNPWVERIHAEGERYRALVLGGEQPEEGVLLTIEQSADTWSVVKVELVPSDYLWPTK